MHNIISLDDIVILINTNLKSKNFEIFGVFGYLMMLILLFVL